MLGLSLISRRERETAKDSLSHSGGKKLSNFVPSVAEIVLVELAFMGLKEAG